MLDVVLSIAFVAIPFAGPFIGYYTYRNTMRMAENKYIMVWTIGSLVLGIVSGLWLIWAASC